MNNVDIQYIQMLKDTLDYGTKKITRAGEVKSIFGRMMRFNLKDGLPLLTTKKVFHRGCIEELLWFLQGSTNIKYLVERNVNIWTDDAYRWYRTILNKHNKMVENRKEKEPFVVTKPLPIYDILPKELFVENVLKETRIQLYKETYNEVKEYVFGDLGDVYGKQWRSFGNSNVDQIQQIINTLKTNPDDRRMLCIAFNPDVLNNVALPPCHVMFQFYTKELENGKRELSLMWTQRSCDEFLGFPYNLLSYSVLTHMIAQVCDMEVGEILCSLGDCHIYLNHLDAVMEQIGNDPKKYNLPTLELNPNIKDINSFKYEDIKIKDYQSFPKIKANLLVGI